ncbi:MAG TPA: C25 family cysteine peptidase, partial [Candidatus Thermoplasmatota archaeon]
KVGDPRLLLVPTQKARVDGGTPELGGGVPEGLDHFKCYDVDPRGTEVRTVTLWDQFDAGNSPSEAKVLKALYLCNPTRKIHHDFEHNTVTGVQNARGHLVCYAIDAPRHARDLVLNNQFGDGQEVSTGSSAMLCVPSVKRIPRPNPNVMGAFDLLAAQIAAVGGDLLTEGGVNSFVHKLRQAQGAYEAGNICLADNMLNAFLNHAQALRAGDELDDDDEGGGDDDGRGHDDDSPGKGKDIGEGHDPDRPGNGYGHGENFGDEGGAPEAQGDGSVRHPPDPGVVALAEDLLNRGWEVRNGMSDSFFDVFFDVFVRTSNCYNPAVNQLPAVQILSSDNTEFEVEVSFGQAQMWTVMGGGEAWTQVELPGLEARSGVPGLPALPHWRGLVALPEGASAVMGVEPQPFVPPIDPDKPLRLNLIPFQGVAADQSNDDNRSFDREFADPPFVKDNATYAKDAFFPEEPCTLTPVGQYRDLRMAQVICAAGQYNPVTDELRLFQKVRVDVEFRGGNGTFVTEQSLNPFESAPSLYEDAALNHAVLLKYVADVDLSKLICWGEELLILTHPNFRSAADNLSAWKEMKGIATTVIEVGSGTSYDTGAEIDDLIEDRYDGCIVRPSYVLLLGDAEWVPPSDTDWDSTIPGCSSCGDATTGSDWGYASYPHFILDVFFPDFAVARMPVDTAAEADTAVNKTIAYESDPPFVNFGAGGPFYTTAGFASVFQCCRMNLDGTPLGGVAGTTQRAFIETSEKARSTLIAAGKSVERMYDETVDNGGCTSNPCPPNPVQQPYSGSTTPNRYYNGALMPAAIRAGSGFAWDATTTDIVNAFNDGRFLMLHRGHGSTSGWADPGFSSSNLGSLSNGELLPVVYSVNCASGKWDIETDSGGTTESLMELLLTKSGGGMVGGLGDNRNSPTWPNNALTRGFFDATWPSLAPEYGGGTSHRRLGDILNHGKVYMLTQVGVAQTAGSVSIESAISEYIMWHAFGDPTLEMWTSNPHRLTLGDLVAIEMDGFDIGFKYGQEGAVITVFEETRNGTVPYGRATVVGGQVNITAFNPGDEAPALENLTLVASYADAVSVVLEQEEEGSGPQSLSLAPLAPRGADGGEGPLSGGVRADTGIDGGEPLRAGAEDGSADPRLSGATGLNSGGAAPATAGAESGLGAAAVASSGWLAFAALALFAGRGPITRGLRRLRDRAGGGGSGRGGDAP